MGASTGSRLFPGMGYVVTFWLVLARFFFAQFLLSLSLSLTDFLFWLWKCRCNVLETEQLCLRKAAFDGLLPWSAHTTLCPWHCLGQPPILTHSIFIIMVVGTINSPIFSTRETEGLRWNSSHTAQGRQSRIQAQAGYYRGYPAALLAALCCVEGLTWRQYWGNWGKAGVVRSDELEETESGFLRFALRFVPLCLFCWDSCLKWLTLGPSLLE